MRSNKTLLARVSVAAVLAIACQQAGAQDAVTAEEIAGLWNISAEGDNLEHQDTILIIDVLEDGQISAGLLHGADAEPGAGGRTGFRSSSFDGSELVVNDTMGAWARLRAEYGGTRLTGRFEYAQGPDVPLVAERIVPRVTNIVVTRDVTWGDIYRGTHESVFDTTTDPWVYEDLRNEWDSAVVAGNLPSVTIRLEGDNLPMHLYAPRIIESLDPNIFSFGNGGGYTSDRAITIEFMLRADTEPGTKTLTLNGVPYEWTLEYQMPEPVPANSWVFRHTADGIAPLDEPLLLGARLSLQQDYEGTVVPENMELELMQPVAGTSELVTLHRRTPERTWLRSDHFLILPQELESRWHEMSGDGLVDAKFFAPGETIQIRRDGETIDQIELLTPARIDFVIAVDPQEGAGNESGQPYSRFPFGGNLSEAQQIAERTLLVIGEDLPADIDGVFELDAYGQPLHYSVYRYPSADDESSPIDRAVFDRGWAKFEAVTGGIAGAPTRGEKDSLLITATLEPGARPGFHDLYLNGARAAWRLQYGDNAATVRFVRDLGQGFFEPTNYLYFSERAAVEIVPDVDIGFDEVGLSLQRFREPGDEGDAEAIGDTLRLTATRSTDADGRVVYRTPSIDLRPDDRSNRGRPTTEGVVQLEIDAQTLLTATIDDRNQFLVRSDVLGVDGLAEIGVTPSDYGALWPDVLRRSAACYEDVPERGWRSMPAEQIDSQISINVLNIRGRNDVIDEVPITLGHHGAAIMLRDEFLRMMSQSRAYWVGVRDEPQRFQTFVNSFGSGRVDRDEPLYDIEITDPSGERTWVWEALLPGEELIQRHGVSAAAIDEWRRTQLAVALDAMIASIDESIDHAEGLGDCNTEELIQLTGVAFDRVVAELEPRMVRLVELENPRRLEWEPDLLGRAWLRQVGPVAATIREIEDRHKTTLQVGLASVGLVGGAVMAAANAGWQATLAFEGLIFAGEVAIDSSSYLERSAMLSRSLGTSRVLGNHVYTYAQEHGTSELQLVLTILGSAGGLGVSGVHLWDDLLFAGSQLGRSVVNTGFASAQSGIDFFRHVAGRRLSTLGPAGRATVMEAAASALIREAQFGPDTLREFDRLGINMIETHVLEMGTHSIDDMRESLTAAISRLPVEETNPTLVGAPRFEPTPTVVDQQFGPLNPGAIVDPDAPAVSVDAPTVVNAPSPEPATTVVDETLGPLNPGAIVDPDAPAASVDAPTVVNAPNPEPATTVVDETLGPLNPGAIVDPDAPAVSVDAPTAIGNPVLPRREDIQAGAPLAFEADDGTPVSINLGEQLGGQGGNTRAFAHADDPERAYRVSGAGGGAAVHEANGESILGAVIRSSEGPVTLTQSHNRWVVTNSADGGVYVVEEADRVPLTAAEVIEANGQLTRGQRIAKDRAERFLNRNGIAWTDNSMRNIGLEPIDEANDLWRVKIFDRGGFYRAVGDTPFERWQNAREIQMTINSARLEPVYAAGVASDLIDASQYPQSALTYFSEGDDWILIPLVTPRGDTGFGSVGQFNRFAELDALARMDPAEIDALFEAHYGRTPLPPPREP